MTSSECANSSNWEVEENRIESMKKKHNRITGYTYHENSFALILKQLKILKKYLLIIKSLVPQLCYINTHCTITFFVTCYKMEIRF